SSEVTSWCILAASTAVVAFSARPVIKTLSNGMIGFLDHPQDIVLDGRGAEGMAASLSILLAQALAIPLGILVIGALAGHLLQHRPTWSTSPLEMKLEKLSPLKGFARIFGMQGWVNLVRSILKLAAIGGAAAFALWPERGRLETFLYSDPAVI